MPRFASLVVLTASALAVTACFPEFGFGPGTEGGGDASSSRAASGTGALMNMGGDGGAPTQGAGGTTSQGGFPSHGGEGSGGAPMGGSASTGTVDVPTVPCGDGNSVLVDCTPGQDCCFSSESAAYDHCGASGSCTDYVFTCNEPDDCPSGSVCCADEDILGFTGTISCVTTCNDKRLCAQASDCNSGETCSQYFANSYAPEYAPGYKVCKP